MILEVAVLDVIAGQEEQFEANFRVAKEIISSMKGYAGHQLQKCIEQPGRYILLVNWETLEDHTIGFRQSEDYLQWKQLLHAFYDPFPLVQHYTAITE